MVRSLHEAIILTKLKLISIHSCSVESDFDCYDKIIDELNFVLVDMKHEFLDLLKDFYVVNHALIFTTYKLCYVICFGELNSNISESPTDNNTSRQ